MSAICCTFSILILLFLKVTISKRCMFLVLDSYSVSTDDLFDENGDWIKYFHCRLASRNACHIKVYKQS